MMYENIDFNSIDLTQEPPISEPERQYYFIAKCREYVKEQEELAGHPLTADVVTFGCQMNARDSEKLSGILEQVGYTLSDSEEADFVIYNTCTVRDNANQRVYGRLGFCNSMKRKNPHKKIALCGCMMQEQNVIDKLQKSYRFIDLIFGTHNIFKFAELLCRMFESSGMVIDIWKDSDQIVEDLPVERKYPFKSGINIMFGCNNFCTYCIVPYVRGREKSRRPKEILQEIEKLADDGVVEIMLLGQNVNSYGKNLEDEISFAQLLQEVEKIDKIKRIRFMTSHPKDLSDELIEVGFPGETAEDVDDTIDVIRKVGFDNAFTFIYSVRTGTPAAVMEQVPEEEVHAGFDRVLEAVQETARKQVARLQGQTLTALVEEVNEQDASLVTGRLSNNTIVHFPGSADLIGQIVPVKLEECHGFYYTGHRVEETK